MSFRLELAFGNGKPKHYEVGCDYCEAIGHFPTACFDTFPKAFEAAIREGWDAEEDAHGRVRYSCPCCNK